jgi:hypothetical protein
MMTPGIATKNRGIWRDFSLHLNLPQRKFRANPRTDAAVDVLCGDVERCNGSSRYLRSLPVQKRRARFDRHGTKGDSAPADDT